MGIDTKQLLFLRKLVLIAIFSDDKFFERFVVKGGTAMDLIYKIDQRSSMDLDLSMENHFSKEELTAVKARLKNTLSITFEEQNYKIFDFNFTEKPKKLNPKSSSFWGGYDINFKIIPIEQKNLIRENIDTARRNALVMDFNNGKKFNIDISKHEYCNEKIKEDVDGFTVYVYTPKMLVIEKLRAICQQLPEYPLNNNDYRKARAKDFYDIKVLIKYFDFKFTIEDIEILEKVFNIKKVDISMLTNIERHKSFFEAGVTSLVSTLTAERAKDFDFNNYFEYVIKLSNTILNMIHNKREAD